MKVIEVKEFTAPAGKEFEPTAYPSPGAYIDSAGVLRIAYNLPGLSTLTLFYVGPVSPSLFKEVEEFNPQTLVQEVVAPGINTNDLLKAIAISQNPDLAKELCK